MSLLPGGRTNDWAMPMFVLFCFALPESVTATPPAEAGLLLRAKIAAPLNDFLAGERES